MRACKAATSCPTHQQPINRGTFPAVTEMTTTAILVHCSSGSGSSINRPFIPISRRNSKAPPLFKRQQLASFNTNSRSSTKLAFLSKENDVQLRNRVACATTRRNSTTTTTEASIWESNDNLRRVVQSILWAAEGIYIIWLFLLPYAPGDPVWAISSDTVHSLVGLSLNFFFILPLMNSVGIHLIEAPVLHPMAEGLFNFVIGWTFMFAPLLFTDRKRDRYKGSLDILWGFQMFLTNTFLIPYMAIRLNEADEEYTPRKMSRLSSVMCNGAPVVGLIGGAICLLSASWALFGRSDGDFGNLTDRWEFLVSYLGSERLAYAFIWDICLYIIFQPWLIGENLQNVQRRKVKIVNYLRFVPVFGLVAYLLYLNLDDEL